MAVEIINGFTTETLGFIGTLIAVGAYWPQIRIIISEHCSAGISLRAWGLWLLGTSFILIHALTTQDTVFILLQVLGFILIATVIILTKFYGNRVCHSLETPAQKRKEQRKEKPQKDPLRFLTK